MATNLEPLNILANVACLPDDLLAKIEDLHGSNLQLVIRKKLTHTDMNPDASRLSIPVHQAKDDFLSTEEKRRLNNKEHIEALLIEPCLKICKGLGLWKLQMSNSFIYVVGTKWNNIVHPYEKNYLKADDLVELWTFRADEKIWFALVKFEH